MRRSSAAKRSWGQAAKATLGSSCVSSLRELMSYNEIQSVNKFFAGHVCNRELVYKTPDDIMVMYNEVQRLPWIMRRGLETLLCHVYHLYDGHRTPDAALGELMLRVVFEVIRMNFNVKLNDIYHHTWLKATARDEKHRVRIYKLVNIIRTSRRAMRVAASIPWLRLDIACKKAGI